jgi:hypothetical protein
MDDEELAESVAKRKQAEEHGYIAPAMKGTKSMFGEIGGVNVGGGEDEDDFFIMKRSVANAEDEDFGDDAGVAGGGIAGGATKSGITGGSKKKRGVPNINAPGEGEGERARTQFAYS